MASSARSNPSKVHNAAVLWGINLLIALGFGATHLGQARALHGLTASYVGFILLFNGVASLVFGWIYWRKDSLQLSLLIAAQI
ncbi:MAG: hypothetical protein LAO31_12355 [Acidobacteriia bacterium]|nr:hypothetical protein [Terriglobia bacterium]